MILYIINSFYKILKLISCFNFVELQHEIWVYYMSIDLLLEMVIITSVNFYNLLINLQILMVFKYDDNFLHLNEDLSYLHEVE